MSNTKRKGVSGADLLGPTIFTAASVVGVSVLIAFWRGVPGEGATGVGAIAARDGKTQRVVVRGRRLCPGVGLGGRGGLRLRRLSLGLFRLGRRLGDWIWFRCWHRLRARLLLRLR